MSLFLRLQALSASFKYDDAKYQVLSTLMRCDCENLIIFTCNADLSDYGKMLFISIK